MRAAIARGAQPLLTGARYFGRRRLMLGAPVPSGSHYSVGPFSRSLVRCCVWFRPAGLISVRNAVSQGLFRAGIFTSGCQTCPSVTHALRTCRPALTDHITTGSFPSVFAFHRSPVSVPDHRTLARLRPVIRCHDIGQVTAPNFWPSWIRSRCVTLSCLIVNRDKLRPSARDFSRRSPVGFRFARAMAVVRIALGTLVAMDQCSVRVVACYRLAVPVRPFGASSPVALRASVPGS